MTASKHNAWVGLALLIAIISLGLFLYSPWHVHEAKAVCPFSTLERSACDEAAGQISILPPATAHWVPPAPVPAPRPDSARSLPRSERAPPSNLSFGLC